MEPVRGDKGDVVNPPESKEQEAVAQYLDALNVVWCHVPNERKANAAYYAKLKRQGVKAGVPDNLIFNPSKCGTYAGLAIELKRRKGGTVSESQRNWQKALQAVEWKAVICKGADEAIKEIQEYLGL